LGEAAVETHRLRVNAHGDVVPPHVYSFRFPVSHLHWLQLVSLDIVSLRWRDKAEYCNRTLLGSRSEETLRIAWNEQAGKPYAVELPTPCSEYAADDADESPSDPYSASDRHYGLSISALHDWGSQLRAERSGRMFRPRGGREAFDAVVSRLNDQRHQQLFEIDKEEEEEDEQTKFDNAVRDDPHSLAYISLSLYYRSTSAITLRELVVRKCLLERTQPTALQFMQGDVGAAAAEMNVTLARSLQSVPVALSVLDGETLQPTLVPTRSCVWEEYASGTCFVDLGWINTGTEIIEARGCEEGNCLHPSRVRAYTSMPEQFTLGWHVNHTRVAWLCRGTLPGEWNTLRWELGSMVVQIDHTTPMCRNTRSLQYAVSSGEIIPFEHYRFDETGLRYWDMKDVSSDNWMPSDSAYSPEGLARAQQNGVLGRIIAARCVEDRSSCSDDDDSGLIIQAAGLVIAINLIMVAVAVYFGYYDPTSLFYMLATIDTALLGIVAWNFLFAPQLSRPNGVVAPDPLVGSPPSLPNVL
jgi:hypothetical protein